MPVSVGGSRARGAAAVGSTGPVAGPSNGVGAGSGSYEPEDCLVIAAEPSTLMLDQRPPGSAPCVQAVAEALPMCPQLYAKTSMFRELKKLNRKMPSFIRPPGDWICKCTLDTLSFAALIISCERFLDIVRSRIPTKEIHISFSGTSPMIIYVPNDKHSGAAVAASAGAAG